MDLQEKKRFSIVNATCAEMSPVEILTVFKYKKDTVYRLKKKYADFIAAGGSPDQLLTQEKCIKSTRTTRTTRPLP